MSANPASTAPATANPRSREATRQAWVERLQRFADSGLPPAEFCAAEGVSLPSFYSWRRRLAAPPTPTATTDPAVPAPRLLPVHLPATTTPVLELALPSGTVLRIPPGTDPESLRPLLRLLGVLPC